MCNVRRFSTTYKIKLRSKCFQSVTGCINPSTVDRLNPDDSGGQYDSSGGIDEAGNPVGSTCAGWALCIIFNPIARANNKISDL